MLGCVYLMLGYFWASYQAAAWKILQKAGVDPCGYCFRRLLEAESLLQTWAVT